MTKKVEVFHNVFTLKGKWSIGYSDLSVVCFIGTSKTNSWVLPQNLPWLYIMSYFITHIQTDKSVEKWVFALYLVTHTVSWCVISLCFKHEYFPNISDVYYITRVGPSSRIIYLLTLFVKLLGLILIQDYLFG